MRAKPIADLPAAGLFQVQIRERRSPPKRDANDGVCRGRVADSITRHSVVLQSSVSPSDLSATSINDNNYNSRLHTALQVTKRTSVYYSISCSLYACKLTSNFTLHTMKKPRKVKGPGQGGNDCSEVEPGLN